MIPHDRLPLDHTRRVSKPPPRPNLVRRLQSSARDSPHAARRLRVLGTAAALTLGVTGCSEVTLQDAQEEPSSSVSASTAPPTAAPPATDSPTTTQAETTTTTTAPTTTEPIIDRAIPETQGDLVVALTEAEEAIRNPNLDDAEASQWGQRQQRLYRVLAENPDWGNAVIAAVSDESRFGVEQNWAARQALSSLVKSAKLADSLPAWQLREPLPVEELMAYYREAEAQTGIPWSYLAAINLVETRMGRIEGFSTAGATGPMQFLPSTWAECCEGDPTIDRDAIIGAGVYLVLVGGASDIQKALYRYNNSDRYVNAVTAYAEVMAKDELAYRGYHAWQVYFLSSAGLIRMPADYYQPEPIPVEEWLATHPEALLVPAG